MGILGGSFDPPHAGHLACARAALETGGLDRVIFIPAYLRPHKHRPAVSPRLRLRLLCAAVRGLPRVRVCPVEIRRRGTSYTVDTLKYLGKKIPGAEFVLVVGEDNLHEFHTWKSPAEILRRASLLVLRRHGHRKTRRPLPLHRSVRMPYVDVSSTEIRRRLRAGESVTGLVPPAVERLIERYKLYRK